MSGLEAYGRIEGADARLREEQAIERLRSSRPRKQPRRWRLLTASARLLRRTVLQGT